MKKLILLLTVCLVMSCTTSDPRVADLEKKVVALQTQVDLLIETDVRHENLFDLAATSIDMHTALFQQVQAIDDTQHKINVKVLENQQMIIARLP